MSKTLDKKPSEVDLNDPEYLTVKDIAARWGVSTETVRRWDRLGLLEPKGTTGRGWRYYLFTDVDQLLKDRANALGYNQSGKSTQKPKKDLIEPLSLAQHILVAVQQDDHERALLECEALILCLKKSSIEKK